MRTKAIILSAAVLAAGVASSMAQSNVYSLNVVGYVNVTIAPGFNMLANPLDDGAGNYLTNVIQNVPNNSVLFPWAVGTYGNYQTFFSGYGWYDGNLGGNSTNVIAPGSGFWVQNAATTNSTITFVGSVLQGTTSNALTTGFTLTGSTEPLAVPIGVAGDGLTNGSLQFPAANNDVLYVYQNGTYGDFYTYFSGYGWYDGNNANLTTNGPTIPVAQGFFIQKSAPAIWVQSFNVH